jgi:hypothetical protein
LISAEDPRSLARAVLACVLGMLMQARIRNDPGVLMDLEPVVLRIIGRDNSQPDMSVVLLKEWKT